MSKYAYNCDITNQKNVRLKLILNAMMCNGITDP